MNRYRSASNPCPICGGHDRAQRGQGIRCYGYESTDGKYAHCTHEGFRGAMQAHQGKGGGETYAHRLRGPCRCGVQHGEDAQVRDIGESPRAEVIAEYDYCDESGTLVYQVLRMHPKGFRQRRPDGHGGWHWNLQGVTPQLYKLPELLESLAAGDDVWIVEGERDVETLTRKGAVATCNSGGCGKFPPAQATYFRGATVTIVADKDDPGRKHARQVFDLVVAAEARSVEIVEARHGKDATDHIAAGGTLQDFVRTWPEEPVHPQVARKREILRSSFDVGAPFETHDDIEGIAETMRTPHWPTGLRTADGAADSELGVFRGVTLVAGAPGAAKSYLAIASSLHAAMWGGWEVLYLSAEMHASIVAKRVMAHLRSGKWLLPENWRLVTVRFGATAEKLVDLLCENMTEKKTLVVFDSLSSFIDQGLAMKETEDAHGMGALKRMLMWMLNVRSASAGEISFLALSELNREGKTKGRFADHKADLVVTMESGENREMKTVSVAKGWEADTGLSRTYLLEWEKARLTRV